MSRRPEDHALPRWAAGPRRTENLLVAVAVLAMLALGIGRASVAIAQDEAATPMASPVAGPCDAPALPPGTPTPQDEASPEAMVMPEMATPVAEVPEATPVGSPADAATAEAVIAGIENIANCINAGNYEAEAALYTDNYLMENYGTTNPYDVVAEEQEFPTPWITVVFIEDVQTLADGRATAHVAYQFGEHFYAEERFYMVEEDGYWKQDDNEYLPPQPEGDTAVVGVAMSEYAFTPNVTTITQQPVIIFHAINQGVEAHELVVLRIPEGADPMGLLDGSLGFDQIEFLGGVFDVAPGAEQDAALINLEPGVYTLVCFFPSPDGTPHIALGMVTQVEVVAPAA